MSVNLLSGWIYFVIDVAVMGLVLWALISAATRPAQDFAYAQKKKGFWVGILVAALLVTGNGWLYYIPLPFSGMFSLAAIFAAVYFLGPENQRMGPRRRGGGSGGGSSGGRSSGPRGGW